MSGSVTFDPNVTSKSFNLMVVSDETPELDEKLVILLTSATLLGNSDGKCLVGLECVRICTNTVHLSACKQNRPKEKVSEVS